ncbi:hypothetical protein L3Q82_012237 [Scortum barcoo]|uniref:Uncharacterized protein n=1 Tax=Scortum barcoo TaxID=214431 RepID=A0ACB8W2Y3_9TELE|nr:hypothetical protein L3Q82_012237 [Scortum barcoo]
MSKKGYTLTKKKRKVFFKRWFGPLSLQTSLQLSLCGMNWIDQSEKHVPQISSLLLDELKKAWKAIPGTYLKKLVERMPRICHAVVKARGGYFEESKKKSKSKQEKLKYLIIIVKMSSDKLLFI